MPAGTGVLNDLTLTGDEGMTLGADVTVNGTCSLTGSDIFTGAYTLTLGPTAVLAESDGKTVIGTVTTTRTAAQSVNESFGGLGIELNAAGGAPGVTTATRVTGTALSVNGTDGIERYFDLSPANNSGLDATVVLHYDESELNGIDGGPSRRLFQNRQRVDQACFRARYDRQQRDLRGNRRVGDADPRPG